MLRLFEWCEATAIGSAVRESVWLFPAIEAVHLIGLSLLFGAIIVVDLRLLGLGLSHRPIAEVLGGARPWMVGSVGQMVMTGVPLFLSESVKCYYNPSFWVKMTALPIAIAFTFGVRDRIARRPAPTSFSTRATGVVSLVLWFTVAAAGRWIGYSS
jgi:hypothetical protein